MKDVNISGARVAQEFRRFRLGYERWLRTEARFSGTSVPRLRLLEILYKSGPQVMTQLGQELGVTPRTITALVDGLARDAMVERIPHEFDRRAKVIQLTGPGRAFCDEVQDRFTRTASSLFEVLDDDERQRFLALLQKLGSHLQSKD